MRRTIVTAICILFSYILQTAVFGIFKLADTVPNIILILIVSIAVMRGQKESMIAGFFTGLLLDLFYSAYLGPFAFLYMFMGFVNGFFHRIYYAEDTFLPLFLVGVNDVAYGFIMYIGQGLLRNHMHILLYIRRIILPEIVYTIAVAMLYYRILLRVNNWLEKYEKGSVEFV